jgi:hypothetical protein
MQGVGHTIHADTIHTIHTIHADTILTIQTELVAIPAITLQSYTMFAEQGSPR